MCSSDLPAAIVAMTLGDSGVAKLLVLSQVILSLQLPFAVIPLVSFVGSQEKMGPMALRGLPRVAAWLAAALIVGLNAWLVVRVWGF